MSKLISEEAFTEADRLATQEIGSDMTGSPTTSVEEFRTALARLLDETSGIAKVNYAANEAIEENDPTKMRLVLRSYVNRLAPFILKPRDELERTVVDAAWPCAVNKKRLRKDLVKGLKECGLKIVKDDQ